jgi:hypothetical protein
VKTYAAIFLNCALPFAACKDRGADGDQVAKGFAIYKLADTTILASSVWDASLDSLELSPKPFLGDSARVVWSGLPRKRLHLVPLRGRCWCRSSKCRGDIRSSLMRLGCPAGCTSTG